MQGSSRTRLFRRVGIKEWAKEILYCAALVLIMVFAALCGNRTEPRTAIEDTTAIMEIKAEAVEQSLLQLPPGLTVIRPYMDVPVWNPAYGQWETHRALDCILPGNEIPALCDGTVIEVHRNSIYGGHVDVKTGAYLMRYASILPEAAIRNGAPVRSGDIIGTAHAGMPGEAHLGAHLHLEIYKNAELIDFMDADVKIENHVD